MVPSFIFLVLLCSLVPFTCRADNSTTPADCQKLSNNDCQTCLALPACGYCKTNKACFLYQPSDAVNGPCGLSDQQYQNCVEHESIDLICGLWIIFKTIMSSLWRFQWEMFEYYRNFQVWIIIVAVLAGVLLLAVLIIVCCICRSCKKRRVRKEEQRQERQEQSAAVRGAAADERTAERTRVADQMRMKYGILKEKENNNDYKRMG